MGWFPWASRRRLSGLAGVVFAELSSAVPVFQWPRRPVGVVSVEVVVVVVVAFEVVLGMVVLL